VAGRALDAWSAREDPRGAATWTRPAATAWPWTACRGAAPPPECAGQGERPRLPATARLALERLPWSRPALESPP